MVLQTANYCTSASTKAAFSSKVWLSEGYSRLKLVILSLRVAFSEPGYALDVQGVLSFGGGDFLEIAWQSKGNSLADSISLLCWNTFWAWSQNGLEIPNNLWGKVTSKDSQGDTQVNVCSRWRAEDWVWVPRRPWWELLGWCCAMCSTCVGELLVPQP